MSAKHTPGPWRVDDRYGQSPDIVGRPSWKCRRYAEEGEWSVATIDDMLGEHWGEVEANARLIAAAPELAEVLVPLLRAVDDEIEQRKHGGNAEDWNTLQWLSNKGHAALRKAGIQ